MTETTSATLKQRVQQFIDEIADTLIQVSQTIHAHPETAFQEYNAMALLTNLVEQYGYTVERGVAGLETAFIATSRGREPGPTIAFLAEYDALPGLGHACGHNIIGTASTGAALAMQVIRDEIPGVIKLIGTPAEESGGGKAIMVERGIFKDIDAAMMVHPSTKTMTTRKSLASNALTFEFFGRSAHAAAAPEMGINALEACIQTFNNINALRQHLPPDVRIHGVITHGGDAPNIVPEYAAARFGVRAADSDYSFEVVEKVIRCAQAAAMAMGAELKYSHERHYANMVPNPTLAHLFAENLTALGETVVEPDPDEPMGSTDMGNVSQVVPALHAYIAIADPGIPGHTVEFREAAASERGNGALLRAAKALAMTAVDLLTHPELVARAKVELRRAVNPDATWRKRRFFDNP